MWTYHESKTICLVLMAMALIYRQFGMIVIVTLTKLMNPVVTVCVNRNVNGHTKETLQHGRDGTASLHLPS